MSSEKLPPDESMVHCYKDDLDRIAAVRRRAKKNNQKDTIRFLLDQDEQCQATKAAQVPLKG